MNDKVKNHLLAYSQKKGWNLKEDQLKEILTEATPVHKEDYCNRRHWSEHFVVVEIDGMYISFIQPSCTGDLSPEEVGCEFDYNQVYEVKKIEKTVTQVVTTYEKI